MNWFFKRIASALPEGLQTRLRQRHYETKLRNAKITDEPDLAVIALLTKRGDTVLDIGANFGLFTRFLSEAVGHEGKVISFEPTQTMYEVLHHNCIKLGLTNTTCVQSALSDTSGQFEMVIPLSEDGILNHYEASLNGSSNPVGKTILVETQTLDDFCSLHGIDQIDFIKCDVEGHEIEVLNGAHDILQRHRPPILLEVNAPLHKEGHGARVFDLIRSLDYEIHTVRDGALHPWQAREDDNVNYVLTPRQTV